MKLGSNLQYLRKLHGNMTQEKLAERMGVSRQTVSKWETGEAVPDVDKLLELSGFFSCTLDALLKEEMAPQADYYSSVFAVCLLFFLGKDFVAYFVCRIIPRRQYLVSDPSWQGMEGKMCSGKQ